MPEETEKIIVENQTSEDVEIYYMYHKTEHYLNTVNYNDTKEIYVSLNTLYFARGKRTNKDYGSRTFEKVPSYIHDKQTWVIR